MVMSRKTQLRPRAREIALQLVYMNDMRPGATVAEMLEEFPVDEAVTLFDGELRAEEDEKPSQQELCEQPSSFIPASCQPVHPQTHEALRLQQGG